MPSLCESCEREEEEERAAKCIFCHQQFGQRDKDARMYVFLFGQLDCILVLFI